MDVRQMREIPIADFLNAMGIQPTKQRGNALWYSAPYRTERSLSASRYGAIAKGKRKRTLL